MEKKKPERTEISLMLGEERSWRPVNDGKLFVNAVAVIQRDDLRGVIEYTYGWGIFDAKMSSPKREDITFLPRTHIGHGDTDEALRLIGEAKKLVDASFRRADPDQASLTFRMSIPKK